jgi:predicted HTH transcriptional regulator
MKAKIVDLISDHCDPSIEVHVDSLSVNDIPIILVKVAEGTNRPYRYCPLNRDGSQRRVMRKQLFFQLEMCG